MQRIWGLKQLQPVVRLRLTRRTEYGCNRTASILPKMLNTANSTEQSVKSAGVEVPLMIMRGDGGVMEISEMKKRPVLTMLSGPAASVMGSLMCLSVPPMVYILKSEEARRISV